MKAWKDCPVCYYAKEHPENVLSAYIVDLRGCPTCAAYFKALNVAWTDGFNACAKMAEEATDGRVTLAIRDIGGRT